MVKIKTNKNHKYIEEGIVAEFKRISSCLHLPIFVEEDAKQIYQLAIQKKLQSGRTKRSLITGAIYIACRQHKSPRTLNEIVKVSGVFKKEIYEVYKLLIKELMISMKPINPTDYIPRFASDLKLSSKIQLEAIEILRASENNPLVLGKNPVSLAATALYLASEACGDKRPQRDFADVSEMSETAIRRNKVYGYFLTPYFEKNRRSL